MRRLARIIATVVRGLARMVAVALWLAGLPLVLISFVGSPMPTSAEISGWPQTAVTWPMALHVISAVGWLTWLVLVYLLLSDLAARLGNVRLPRLRLPAGVHTVVAGVVGATVVPVHAAAGPPAAVATVATAATPTVAATATPGHRTTVTFLLRGHRYHVLVRKGDTMSTIARQWLGDAGRWPEICRLNAHRHWPRVGGTLRDCDRIYPRWDLRLPADAVAPAGARRADTPSVAPAAPPKVEPVSPSPPSPPAVTSAAPSPSAAGDRQDEAETAASPRDGVELPGGWLAWSTAAAILALYASVLLRRRARTQPPAGLPVLIRHITRPEPLADDGDEVTQTADATDSDDTDTTAHDRPELQDVHRALLEQTAAAGTTVPAMLGAAGDQQLDVSSLPQRGVGLAGSGADAALRGILASLLTSGEHGYPGGTARVVVTADVMARLGTGDIQIEHLDVAQSTAALLHQLQMEIHDRYQHGASGAAAPKTAGPLVVIADVPQADDATRLAALADLGHPHNIHIIVAGMWAQGVTWTVDANGDVSGHDVAMRLNRLDGPSFAEVLAMAAEHDHPDVADASPAQTPSPGNDGGVRRFQLDVLGEVQLFGPQGQPLRIVRSGTKQIAVLLALHPDGCEREDLLEWVFGHVRRKTAPGSLNTCVSELRTVLRHPDSGVSALATAGARYRLDPAAVDTDWWQFNRLVDSGQYAAAVGLDRGPLAGDRPWDALTEHREHVRAHVSAARQQLGRDVRPAPRAARAAHSPSA
ncbi:hypothetical protein AB0M47_39075 [Hamadaea sp. NPDC051192]|uniref:hypothetical protein n=1 Tax=Hamadaea sp. NPDC051192 TaxID=3154940 RepID=UPI0034410D1A